MMPRDAELATYVKDAKEQLLADEVIALMLSQAGWSRRQIGKVLADHYETTTGLQVPKRSGATESAGIDWFLYSVAAAAALTWIVGLINLCGPLLTIMLERDYDSDFDTQYVPAFLLAVPIQLIAMLMINRRLRNQLTPTHSPARITTSVILMVCGAGALFYLATVALTAAFSGRGHVGVAMLTLLVGLLAIGGTMLYYWRWLRWEVEEHAKG